MEPFVGEVRIFPWDWAPRGWARCDGSLLPISQNQALFSLIGVAFGGNGTTTLALPDLRGRTPVHMGTGADGANYERGAVGGSEAVALTVTQLPAHTHLVGANSDPGNFAGPNSSLPASAATPPGSTNTAINIYDSASSSDLMTIAPDTCTPSGGGAPHNNVQPTLVVNFCIATSGLYPPRQ